MFILFSLIFVRMSGAIALNPVFGRTGIPTLVKSALVMVISLLLYISFGGNLVHEPTSMIEYGMMLVMELLFGVTMSLGMELSLTVVRFSSAVMDFSMGLNMAQVYDPQSNSQMTVTSGLYYAFLIMLFFATNGHLRLMAMFIRSGMLIPFGTVTFKPELTTAILAIFSECIVMGLQLALPIVAMELVAETAVGILMRIVPQINVFSVNFQVKIIVGLLMLLMLFGPMSDKLYVILDEMFVNLEQLMRLMR